METRRGKAGKSAQSGKIARLIFRSWPHSMRIFLHLATEREELTRVTYIPVTHRSLIA
jgi:hypothetical protein